MALTLLLGVTGCSTDAGSTSEIVTIDTVATSAPTPGDAPGDGATTTTPLARSLDVTIEPTGWQDVTITTDDGLALNAKHWPGGDTALLFGHDFDNPTPGAAGRRAPQSSEVILPYSSALAREGYTVLSPDFRGHGSSEGEFNVRESQSDLAAAYAWLRDAGHQEIVMIGWVGSGTAAVVLDVDRTDIEFAGIAMLFSPPQDTGLDANRVLPEIGAPMYFIGSNAGQSASWARRMEAKVKDSRGVYIFERVPSGLTFIDVYGGELAGRVLQFVEGL